MRGRCVVWRSFRTEAPPFRGSPWCTCGSERTAACVWPSTHSEQAIACTSTAVYYELSTAVQKRDSAFVAGYHVRWVRASDVLDSCGRTKLAAELYSASHCSSGQGPKSCKVWAASYVPLWRARADTTACRACEVDLQHGSLPKKKTRHGISAAPALTTPRQGKATSGRLAPPQQARLGRNNLGQPKSRLKSEPAL